MSETGKRRAITVQLSIHAPTGTPAHIIQRAVIHKCETGENTPGISITVIDWTGRKEASFDSDEAFHKLRHVIRRAQLQR